ncbi:isoprenylcysteine carboxylmethyltransferase family protein [uncultured Dysgonomonas sp.]|uniref:methyltransferase family protein n=1 Tax=uncultured Dysgonomonas sp. TaxID=206096 RepID=UPI002623D366|nr:isoprenylcysteine carboxylmethyltransferase family protein [uncultured Dysgonomonas sp.]
MMIQLGNFFFRCRNIIFIFLYLLLFVPSAELFGAERWGDKYFLYPIVLGLLITVSGQLIRGGTIGLAYIIRGGQNRQVYADGLVTTGIFNHVRNPLYIGNILMLWGAGIMANSFLFTLIIMPLFLCIYQCIVLAEEAYLKKKFGMDFIDYTKRVNRWVPNFKGIGDTFSSMKFNWKRWLIKEYGTQFVWLLGIAFILLYKYPTLIGRDPETKLKYAGICLLVIGTYYLTIRFMKKSGRWK